MHDQEKALDYEKYFPYTNLLRVNIWDDYQDGNDTFLYVESGDISLELGAKIYAVINHVLKDSGIDCEIEGWRIILRKLRHDQISDIMKILQGKRFMIFELYCYGKGWR